MTMNHVDAQAFLATSSKAFSQLKTIFATIDDEATQGKLSERVCNFIGAGRHIAESMAETVGYWAEDAAGPWLEDAPASPPGENKTESSLDCYDITYELCSIKALVDAADRAIWQDGCVADDNGLVIDAAYMLRSVSAQISKLIEKI